MSLCVSVHMCSCYNHALKTNILLENRTPQHFLRRLGKCILPQLTVPDGSYRQCQYAARIFWSCWPHIYHSEWCYRCQMQLLRKLKFPGGEIFPWHLHFESQIGKENPSSSLSSQIAWTEALTGGPLLRVVLQGREITTAEERVINGCPNSCRRCAHKPFQSNVW